MTPAEVWKALAVCETCGAPVDLLDPIRFVAPKPLGKWEHRRDRPPEWDGFRYMVAGLYFRDPFHHPDKPFANFCSAACGLTAIR
jgi:hypothetical protein